jgi:hypothetical protein
MFTPEPQIIFLGDITIVTAFIFVIIILIVVTLKLSVLFRFCETMSLWNWVFSWYFGHPPYDTRVNTEQRWSDIGRENQRARRKYFTLPLYPPQSPHGLVANPDIHRSKSAINLLILRHVRCLHISDSHGIRHHVAPYGHKRIAAK